MALLYNSAYALLLCIDQTHCHLWHAIQISHVIHNTSFIHSNIRPTNKYELPSDKLFHLQMIIVKWWQHANHSHFPFSPDSLCRILKCTESHEPRSNFREKKVTATYEQWWKKEKVTEHPVIFMKWKTSEFLHRKLQYIHQSESDFFRKMVNDFRILGVISGIFFCLGTIPISHLLNSPGDEHSKNHPLLVLQPCPNVWLTSPYFWELAHDNRTLPKSLPRTVPIRKL